MVFGATGCGAGTVRESVVGKVKWNVNDVDVDSHRVS